MKAQRTILRRLWMLACLMGFSITPAIFAADRELHWDALEVEARLNAAGVLDVVERHTMVFTGDWNGGERVFDLRPNQKIEFLGMQRIDGKTGAGVPLRQTPVPNEVDAFAWADPRTLRWRSRLPSDPPFLNTPLIYELHYRLSGILLMDDAGYRLDHDFAFPNRPGPITRFTLHLVLDPVWQPPAQFQDRYTAGPLPRRRSFVLTIPLRYSGTGELAAVDVRRPKEIVPAVAAIFMGFILLVLGFFRRERALGRFSDIDTTIIDRAWIRQHILSNPAEVVGTAWDGRVGTPEVVALIARMTAEGKLESEVSGKNAMTLRLKVERETLNGHERALVDGLFFDKRTETTTTAVKKHYENTGFNPAQIIRHGLSQKVKSVIPQGKVRISHLVSIVLFLVAAGLFGWSAYLNPIMAGAAVFGIVTMIAFSAILQIPGWIFRTRIDMDRRAAMGLLIPSFLICFGTALFLWFGIGGGRVESPVTVIGALVAWALCIASTSINGMKSRQTSEAIAFRKRLAAGRVYFMQELNRARPNLEDEWYPWLLAFGLGKQMDAWTSGRESTSSTYFFDSQIGSNSTSSSTSGATTSFSGSSWTGGGGLSGGAGATGAWTAAAAGMAAGVSAPSSGDSGGGGSSSGGSSGGGGGGGW
jgi:hypothetical protein